MLKPYGGGKRDNSLSFPRLLENVLSFKKSFTRFQLLTIMDRIGKKSLDFPRHSVAIKADEPHRGIGWRQERRF
jgi:hypothetical protein